MNTGPDTASPFLLVLTTWSVGSLGWTWIPRVWTVVTVSSGKPASQPVDRERKTHSLNPWTSVYTPFHLPCRVALNRSCVEPLRVARPGEVRVTLMSADVNGSRLMSKSKASVPATSLPLICSIYKPSVCTCFSGHRHEKGGGWEGGCNHL